MSEPNYSVLMSVYKKENADNLRTAMDSMWNQTIPTNDFVLVCDGPLTKELDAVIDEMIQTHGKQLNVVRLKENKGLGYALNVGIEHCKNALVARMDSDDISFPDRCEKQLSVFDAMPKVAICSGTVEEFRDTPGVITARRRPPEKNWQILEYAKRRDPFNHPCVMYRKTAVLEAGGYIDFYLLEDYHLWIRMLMNDCIGYNIQESLLWMRAGSDLYLRRGGLKYAISQIRLFAFMYKVGYIKRLNYLLSVFVRVLVALLPNIVRSEIYSMIRRMK